jgi:hypothetical protein
VKGEKKDIEKLHEVEFSFQKLRPCPFIDENGDSTSDSWYKWCLTNWGTHRDVYEYNGKIQEDGTLTVTLDTAYTPPIELLKYITKKMPSLNINLIYLEEVEKNFGEINFSDKKQEIIRYENYRTFMRNKFDIEIDDDEEEEDD